MTSSKKDIEAVRQSIEKLEPEPSSFELVEIILPEIETARARGVSYRQIFEMMRARIKLSIGFSTFRQYVKQAKTQRKDLNSP